MLTLSNYDAFHLYNEVALLQQDMRDLDVRLRDVIGGWEGDELLDPRVRVLIEHAEAVVARCMSIASVNRR